MKYKYAIQHEDGRFLKHNKSGDVDFFCDSITLFEKEIHAKAEWEVLPYYQAVKCKIVKLSIAESVNKTEITNVN